MNAADGETPTGPGLGAATPRADAEWEAARAALARLRAWGGEPLVREMTAIFLAEMPRRLAAARAALRAGDGGAAAHAAHTMKSSCGQLGAVALAALCAAAESLARNGELAPVAPLLDAADAELARFATWLDHTAGGAAAPAERGVPR